MTKRINIAEAKAKLSAVVDDVRLNAQAYLIERHGRPAAAIISVEALAKLEASDILGPSPAGALALAGAWADVEEAAIDDFLDDVRRSRSEDMGRIVHLAK